MSTTKELELVSTPQQMFDHFNEFIISGDTKIFNKLMARTMLYNEIKNIPGDIVECGVFKGSGFYTFLKLKKLLNANSSRQIIGFDFFNSDKLVEAITSREDKKNMELLFRERHFQHRENFVDILQAQLVKHGFAETDFKLVAGDVSNTTKQFVKDNTGFKIALLYMDLDLDVPTYDALINLWDNMSRGGLIVFDEYGYHKWSESVGVDRFINEKNLEIKSLDYMCPTAYIRK